MADILALADSRGSKRTSAGKTSTDSVSVAELLALNVPVSWYEGIAITQGLCHALFESGADKGLGIASASSILLTSSGSVKVIGTSPRSGATAVQQVAEVTRDLFTDGDVPTTLRLTLSQAASDPPFYASLKELSQALEYFERPNRISLIQGVFERWKGLVPQPVYEIPALARPEESAAPKPKRDFKKLLVLPKLPPKVQQALILSAAAVVAVILAIGTWKAGSKVLDSPAASGASASVRTAGAAAVKTATSALDKVIDKFIPPPRENPSTAPLPEAAQKPPRRSRPAATPVAAPAAAAQAVEAFDLSMPAAPETTPSDTTTPAAASASAEAAPDSAVYTAQDADVVPPTAIYPRFPSTLPAGVKAADLAEFDVLVTEDGLVEWVKMRKPPRNMSDAMILTMSMSASKTWRFNPGLRNGVPVKYRKIVWVLTH